MAYLLDANVLINAKNHYYRFDVFPGFWAWLDHAHANGVLMSIKKVRDEIMEREDKLSLWCKSRKRMFVDTEDQRTFESMKILSTWVIENYQRAAQEKFLGDADFRLVAFAHAHNHKVVTTETAADGFDVKIPNACKIMDVTCITPFQMLTDEKVKFDLRK